MGLQAGRDGSGKLRPYQGSNPGPSKTTVSCYSDISSMHLYMENITLHIVYALMIQITSHKSIVNMYATPLPKTTHVFILACFILYFVLCLPPIHHSIL